MRGVDDLLAAALRQMTVLDEPGTGVSLGGFWVKRPVVLAFVRHLGCIFCRQQVARLSKRLPEIERRGGTLVVVGPAKPEHIKGFRESTGYQGALFVDPALRAFRTAGLVHGWASTYHPLSVLKGIGALARGFRQVGDRKSTRLNSSHLGISYAVFCLKKKKNTKTCSAHKKIISPIDTCS